MSVGTDLAAYLGGLTLAGGDRHGEAFVVLPWERRFLRGAFCRSGDAALSVARGNGKSAVCAGLAAAVVDPVGPLHGPRFEVVCCAASFEQSRVIFEDVLGFLRGLGYDLDDRRAWRKQDSANRAHVEHRASGARVRCIGSDPKTAHGLRPALALLDEPAQWEPASRDRMLAAIRTGLGKVPGSRLIALGTRPASPAHWFGRMLAGGAAYAQVHAARPDDPPFRVATWRKANPSLDHLPSLRAKIAAEAEDARGDPSLLASFRALRLNGGVSDTEEALLLGADLWALIEGAAERAGPLVWGIDLGGSAAMSAVAGYWPRTGALNVVAAFPSVPDLAERGRLDGVAGLYGQMCHRGELLTLGGRAVDTEALLRVALDRFGQPAVVAADRWKEPDLRDALDAAGVRPVPFESRGMGFKDGGADTEAFRRACATGRVVPQRSLLLRSAMAEARTVTDPAGNSKISKATEGGRRLRARDDAAVAAVIAVAVGARRTAARPSRPRRVLVAG